MPDIIHWPSRLLHPGRISVSSVPFTRGGGRSLGGVDRATRTDRGHWSITLSDIPVDEVEKRRAWNAIRTMLGGRAGLILVPAWSYDSAPWVGGVPVKTPPTVPHDDDSPFDDDSEYLCASIVVQMSTAAAIGATSVTLQIINADASLSGVRFSHQGALYETGAASAISGNLWTVSVFPAIRAPIPAGASLDIDLPTCLVHLAEDRGMDIDLSAGLIDFASVPFVEAVDYWSDLAAGLIT